jgi:hypothetical protein
MGSIPEVVGTVITTAVGFLVSWYLTRSAKRKVPRGCARIELRMNKLYLACGVIGIVMGVASFALLFSDDFHGQRTFLILLAAVNAFIGVGVGVPCAMYYRNHRVMLFERDFTIIDLWGEIQTCNLGDVESVELNKWTGWLHLKTKNGATLKVHSHLIGVNAILDAVTEHNPLKGS